MKKLLAITILSIWGCGTAFALSENPSAIVVEYPSSWTLGNIRYTSCTVQNSLDCVLTNGANSSMLYKNVNGTKTTLYSSPAWSSDDDILGVKSGFTLPAGFSQQIVGNGTYNILKTNGYMNVQAIEYGKWKINNVYFCLYDRGIMTTDDSYPLARKLIVGAYSSQSYYVCPGTYNGFNLADFYNANPYVPPTNPNPCGLTQAEIDAGVTCGGNSAGTGSTNSNDLPVDEESFMFYQQVKIVVTGIILAVLLVFHFFKYVRD